MVLGAGKFFLPLLYKLLFGALCIIVITLICIRGYISLHLGESLCFGLRLSPKRLLRLGACCAF